MRDQYRCATRGSSSSSSSLGAGDWWRHELLPPAKYEMMWAISDSRLQKAAMSWSGALGPWALDRKDARVLCHIDAVHTFAVLVSMPYVMRFCTRGLQTLCPVYAWFALLRGLMLCCWPALVGELRFLVCAFPGFLLLFLSASNSLTTASAFNMLRT